MSIFAGTKFYQKPKCERCDLFESECQCAPVEDAPTRIAPNQQTAKIYKEKRKKGKVVTVIRGLPAHGNDLPALLKTLKNTCGAGGTVADDTIEVQGDHRQTVQSALKAQGYKTKLIGG